MAEPSSIDRLRPALADRYAVEREIGSGGMATVYLAEDLKHHRPVAIKVLDPDLAAAVGADRFLREIETAANLTHPHILPLHDSGEADGFVYYVMPYVEGESLRARLEREQQLPLGDALRITHEIADALDYAHERGVIHRDVKPANILLEAGHAVLADFGVAQAVAGQDETRLTATGVSLGTPSYMSPEQAAGERDLDGRSDQYALGCVLYEMLAGEAPFTGKRAESVVRQHLVADPTPITQVRATVPEAVAEALAKSLAKAPADRFGSTGEFGRVLEEQRHTPATGTATMKERPRADRGWGRAKFGAFALAVILTAAVAALITSRSSSSGADLLEDVVVVLPFSNETGDPAYDDEAKMVALWITDRLGRSGLSRVVPSSSVTLAWQAALERRARDPDLDPRRVVSGDLQAGTMVWGSIFRDGDSLRFEAEITGAGGTARLGAIPAVVVPLADVRGGIESVGNGVMGAMAFHFDPAWAASAPFMSPMPSLTVYRSWSGANEAFASGDLGRALELAGQTVDLDPLFFPAQTFLAVTHLNMGNVAKADSVLLAAEPFLDRMGLGERSQWAWARASLDGDREAAYESVKDVLKRFTSPLGFFTRGFEALRTNRPTEARDVLASLDPDSPALASIAPYWLWLAEAHHVLEEHDAELRVAEAGLDRHPDRVEALGAAMRAYAALGEAQAVADLGEEAIRKVDRPTETLRFAALELRAHGYREASVHIAEEALAHLDAVSEPEVSTPAHRLDRVRILYTLERWEEARRMALESAQQVPPRPETMHFLGYTGTIAARLGETEEAARVSDELASWTGPYLNGVNTRWRANIAAVLGDVDEAVSLLRQAHEEGMWLDSSVHRDLDYESIREHSVFAAFLQPRG